MEICLDKWKFKKIEAKVSNTSKNLLKYLDNLAGIVSNIYLIIPEISVSGTSGICFYLISSVDA